MKANINELQSVCHTFAVVVCSTFLFATLANADTPADRYQLDIPAQDLGVALQQLALTSRYKLLYKAALVAGKTSRPVSGSYTTEQAIHQLLDGTDLTYEITNGSVVLIKSTQESADSSDAPLGNSNNQIFLAQSSSPDSPQVTPNTGDSSKEETPKKIEEVIVTAQRREERLIDVPMSITALSGEQLTAAGIGNALDLSFAVPGLAVSEIAPGRQFIVIRGIGSNRGSSTLTGVYLDELPVTGAGNYIDLRAIDLRRVEVLKGPQGTLFGEGAAGGVIRYITNDPDLSHAGGELSTQFYNTEDGGWSEEVVGVANIPLADTFGLRVAATYENKSGWIDQPSTGREDINDSEVKHVRVKALYMPTTDLRITSMAEIHRNNGGASNVVNQKPLGSSNFLQAVDRSATTEYTDDYDLFNLAVTYDFGFAELLSSTSYAKLDNVYSFTQLIDADPVPWLEILSREAPSHATIASQEFRLASAREGSFNWSVGANYKDSEVVAGYGSSGFDGSLFGGTRVIRGVSPGIKPTTGSESWAGFADVSYGFFGRFEVGGGLRYFDDRRESFDPTIPTLATLSDDFNRLTFRAYVKTQVSKNVNLYVNVASGFRSGGFNSPALVPAGAPASYGTENTLFYEAGTKMSMLDGRVRFDAALFYGEYQGMQENLSTLGVNNQPIAYTTNAQDAELKGFEWDIGWHVTDRLSLTLAGDVIDAEIVWIDPVNTAPAFFVGDPVNFVPDYSLSAGADYRFQWFDSVPGVFSLSFNKQGKSYFTGRANALIIEKQGVAPEVNFLSASVGGEVNGWQWSLFGKNLLDEREFISPSETGWSAQARPRTIGVSIGKAFGDSF